MDLEDIINEEYDGDETEYYDDLTLENCRVILNLRKSEYFRDVNSLFNKYRTFVTYLLTYLNDARSDRYKLQQYVDELRTILASREHELKQVKHERNVLMDELTCKQCTYSFNNTTHDETTYDTTTTRGF